MIIIDTLFGEKDACLLCGRSSEEHVIELDPSRRGAPTRLVVTCPRKDAEETGMCQVCGLTESFHMYCWAHDPWHEFKP